MTKPSPLTILATLVPSPTGGDQLEVCMTSPTTPIVARMVFKYSPVGHRHPVYSTDSFDYRALADTGAVRPLSSATGEMLREDVHNALALPQSDVLWLGNTTAWARDAVADVCATPIDYLLMCSK